MFHAEIRFIRIQSDMCVYIVTKDIKERKVITADRNMRGTRTLTPSPPLSSCKQSTERTSVPCFQDDFSSLRVQSAMCPSWQASLDEPGERLLSHGQGDCWQSHGLVQLSSG